MGSVSIPGIIGIWMVTGIILAFMFFGTMVITGVNFVGVPMVMFGSALVHTTFIVWILIVMIKKAEKFENYDSSEKNLSYNKNI